MAERREAKGVMWWMPLVLLGAIAAIYANSLSDPFYQDDFQMFVHNERLHRLWPPTLAFWADPSSSTWGRPVSALAFALNYAVSDTRPAGYHVVNIILHSACALLLMGVVRRTLRVEAEPQPQPERPTGDHWTNLGASWVAFIIALLWAVHPLNTEAVSYLSARTELVVSLFLLGMIYTFLRGWRVASVICCALGMASKEIMIVAPIVMLLFDGLFVARSPVSALRERWRFYLALACTWLVLAAVLLRPELRVREHISLGSWFVYLRTQAGVIVHYLRLVFWPKPLVIDYFGYPLADRITDTLPQAMLLLVLLGLSLWGVIRRHWLGFVGAWCFLILAPTSSVYPIWTEVATERRMYLPLMGIIAALVILAAAFARRRGHRTMVVSSIIAAVVAFSLAILTVQRNADYHDLVTLTQTALDVLPNNSRAWMAQGSALAAQGDEESALGAFEMAVRTGPRYPHAYLARGGMFARLHRYDLAEADFKTVEQLDPSMPEPHLELGKLYLVQNHLPAAEAEFRGAIELFPYWIDPHAWLAGLLVQAGRLDEAEAVLLQTAREHPGAPQIDQALQRLRELRGARRSITTQPTG